MICLYVDASIFGLFQFTINRSSFIVFFFAFISLLTTSDAYSLRTFRIQNQSHGNKNTQQEIEAQKKDIFMSRGWGAAGMPYSLLYLNQYGKTKHPHSSQLINNIGQYTPDTIYENEAHHGINAQKFVGYPLDEPNEELIHYEESRHLNPSSHNIKTGIPRRQYTVPQLFVSYGWGPMG